MSQKKVAINGFGRIGRLTARNIIEKHPELEIVAINDLGSPENMAYLFEFDSTYGRFAGNVDAGEDFLVIGERKIQVLSQKDPLNLPWAELGVDVVIESTGVFRTQELANKHIQAGAKKVIISAPPKSDEIPTTVLGSNSIDREAYLVSCASCTTNAIATVLGPIVNHYQVQKVVGLTVHAYTATQVLQDGPSKKGLRDGRAAAVNLIPTSTGASKSVVDVYPQLAGKILLDSLRVPVISGSMVYLTIEVDADTTVDEVNSLLQTSCENELKGIVEFSGKELVSSDIVGNSHSSIVDSSLTEVIGNTIKLVIWYDNEWGYSNRLADMVSQV